MSKDNKKIEILPSLLAADMGKLEMEILRCKDALSDELHLDIMDGNFVPNISYGPDIVALASRVAPDLSRNVHLMLSRPDLYVEKFFKSGATTIQVHIEADCDLHSTLKKIRSLGIRAGLVINPETPVEILLPYLSEADEFLVMTVHPGYGGQKFIGECLRKVSWLRSKLPDADIMVDGGINNETAILSAKAGANQFVSGSFLFKCEPMKDAVERMRRDVAREGGFAGE